MFESPSILAIALILFLCSCTSIDHANTQDRESFSPILSIQDNHFVLDGRPIKLWGVRVASATQTDELTQHLIDELAVYKAHGVNMINTYYMGSRGLNSDPFSQDGRRIDPAYQARMNRLIQAAAANKMIVVVGIFYQHAPFGLREPEAVREAVRAVTEALRPYRNIIINIANEQNSQGWEDTDRIFDFRDPLRIIELCELVHQVDTLRLVGGGGYDHEKNTIIGRSTEVDVLLFDTNGPDPNSGELYDRFSAAGISGKPLVNVELFGGWTNNFETGVFPESVRHHYFKEIDAARSRPGLSVSFHNGPWLQPSDWPIRFDLGGAGTPEDPGIRWYFEYLKALYSTRVD